jgi:hypothetical protein
VYASLPLQNNIKTRHTTAKAARRLTAALRRRGSTFQPQTMVYCFMPVTPSTDPQRSSVHINNIKTRTAINIIAPVVGPTVGLFGFLAQVNTVSPEKLHACVALDISNIQPLRTAGCIRYI